MESRSITKEKALIFRITHVDNLPWIVANGLHCRTSSQRDPNFVSIGSPDLIGKRDGRVVPMSPGGKLSDYVPFYFTPWSPMLFNIKTGRGVPQRPMAEIAILVSSIPKLDALKVPYLISDRHAYLELAKFAAGASGLDQIDWQLLRSRNFRRVQDDPEPFDRYQAEALVYGHVPCNGLLGIAVYDQAQAAPLEALLQAQGSTLKLTVRPEMFF